MVRFPSLMNSRIDILNPGSCRSLIMCILTTDDTDEIVHSLEILRSTTAGTGLIHESFNVNNATDFTRPWFAWVNGLFGEAILKVARSQPDILKREFS